MIETFEVMVYKKMFGGKTYERFDASGNDASGNNTTPDVGTNLVPTDTTPAEPAEPATGGGFTSILTVVSMVVFGAIAAWLSWTSNKRVGWSTGMCVFFAIFAFLFNGSYLIAHLVHKVDMGKQLERAFKAMEGCDVKNAEKPLLEAFQRWTASASKAASSASSSVTSLW